MVFAKIFLLVLVLAWSTTDCKPIQDTAQDSKPRFPRAKPSLNSRALARQIRAMEDLLQRYAWYKMSTVQVLLLVMAFGIIPSVLIVNTTLLCWILGNLPDTEASQSVITHPHNEREQQQSMRNITDSMETLGNGTPTARSLVDPTPPPSYDETMGTPRMEPSSSTETVDLDHFNVSATFTRPTAVVRPTWDLGPPLHPRVTTI